MFGKTEEGEFVLLPGANNLFTTRNDDIEIAFCSNCCNNSCPYFSRNPGCKRKSEFLETDLWLTPLVAEAKIFSTLGQYDE